MDEPTGADWSSHRSELSVGTTKANRIREWDLEKFQEMMPRYAQRFLNITRDEFDTRFKKYDSSNPLKREAPDGSDEEVEWEDMSDYVFEDIVKSLDLGDIFGAAKKMKGE